MLLNRDRRLLDTLSIVHKDHFMDRYQNIYNDFQKQFLNFICKRLIQSKNTGTNAQ